MTVRVKYAGNYIEADVCWQNTNEYKRFTGEQQTEVTVTTIKIVAEGLDLRSMAEEYWEREKQKEYGNESIGVRIYEEHIVIGEQKPLGYYDPEEISFDGDDTVIITSKHTNTRKDDV